MRDVRRYNPLPVEERRVGRSIQPQLFLAALLATCAAGCVKTVTHQIAAYQPGQQPTTRPAPQVALYKVKVLGRDRRLHGIDGTERVLSRGDPLGFRTDDDGVVYAIAHDEAFALPVRSEQQVVWFTQYERRTQFGKEVDKAVESAFDVAAVAVVATLEAYIDGLENDDSDCAYDPPPRKHHQRKKHHSK